MTISNRSSLSECGVVLASVGFSLFCLWFGSCVFVWGASSAVSYVNIQNLRKNYNITTCQILNYTSFTHTCEDCNQNSCSYYKCHDVRILAAYPISNNTLITSIFSSFDRKDQYKQSQAIIIKLSFCFL